MTADHWLWRLDAPAWLRAAAAELDAGAAHIHARRAAITHARRAAGMALNAVLVALPVEPADEQRWGRSYIDHLRVLASADEPLRQPLPVRAQQAAASLLAIEVTPTATLTQIGRGPASAAQHALELARALYQDCAELVATR